MKDKIVTFVKKYKVYYLLLLLISILFYSKHLFNADEGVILSGAWHLFNNKEIYTDFFEQIAPGSFYLVYWFFKIFGPHYYVANIVSLIMVFVSAVLIYKTSLLISKSRINFIMPIIFILGLSYFPIINHNIHSLFFIIFSVYFFIISLEKDNLWPLIISGFLAGLSVIFLQQKGLIFLGASGLFLLILGIKEKNKNIFKKILALSLPSLIPILLLLIKWPINILYYNLVKFPLYGYIEVNKTPFYLLMSVFILFLYFVIFLENKTNKEKYLLFVQFFLFVSCIPLPDIYHISIIIFPLLILSPKLFQQNKYFFNKVAVFILGVIIMYSFMTTIFNYKFFFNYKKNSKSLENYISKECPGRYIYSGPFLPNIYFETNKINATSFSFLLEKQFLPEQFETALEEFKNNSPSCAVLCYYPNIKGKFNHQGDNILEQYIKDNYKLGFQENYFSIYKLE